jgi:hypothetical protein
VRPDAIIIADHALARRRAALRSLADFATATDRRLNGPDRFAAGSTGRSSIPPSPRETPVPDWSARYAELIAPEAET